MWNVSHVRRGKVWKMGPVWHVVMGQRNMGKCVCNALFRDVLFVPLTMFVNNAFQGGFPSKTLVWSAHQASMKPMESVAHAILTVLNAGSTQVHVRHVLTANTCLLPLAFLVSMAAHIVLLPTLPSA